MVPDSPESRIGRLEQNMATVQQKVRDLSHDVETLAPVQMAVVEMRSDLRHARDEIAGVRDVIIDDRRAAKETNEGLTKELKAMRDERVESDRASSRQLRNAAVAIVVAIISAVGTIIGTGAHP